MDSQPKEGTHYVLGLSAFSLLAKAIAFPSLQPSGSSLMVFLGLRCSCAWYLSHLYPAACLHSLLFASNCLVGEKSLM